MKKKILKISTVPESLNTFCEGQLKMLSDDFEVVAVSSPGTDLKEIETREQVRVVEIPMERHISLAKDLLSLFRLICLFMKERPYVVHSMTPKAGLLSMLAAWITRVPIRMHTFTGLVFPTKTGILQRILIFMDRLTCFCATYINPEGNGVKNDLRNYGITKKPLHVIANGNVRGINLNYYSALPEIVDFSQTLRQKNLTTFIFVGRLVGDKGINELIQAFTRLYRENEKCRLVLVGPFEDDLDPLLPSTRKIIVEHEAIQCCGEQKDVRPFLLSSDIFVFPSYREGFPNVVLEAGAMGLPSIVTNINGCNEIITSYENGLIVPPQNAYELYVKMKELLENPTLQKQMGVAARKVVKEKFDQRIVFAALMNEYKLLTQNV